MNSGQEILGPKKGKESDFVKGIFKKAREHGAEAVDQNSAPGPAGASSRPTFSGSGFKLGSTGKSITEILAHKQMQILRDCPCTYLLRNCIFRLDFPPLFAYF